MTELEPLGHISEYGLDKLKTRRHYCVSASHRAEKEFTIGIVTLSSAQSAIAERDARIAELDEEIGRLEDENSDLRCEPWPEWARAVLKVIRKHSGYDGYDDATEGVDMPLELSEHLSEMEAEAGRWQARATAAEALLKEAGGMLQHFTSHYDLWMERWSDDVECTVHSRHTFGQLRAARSLASKIGGGE